MDLLNVVDRKHEIRSMAQPAGYVKQRIADAAASLDRSGVMAAHVELCNEALNKFVSILYKKDESGVYACLDTVTQRIKIPAPWGSAGWKRWGLRHWEAVVLRSILMARLKSEQPALFDYNDIERTWHLNVQAYRTSTAAMSYLERCPISVQEWRKHSK